MRRSAARRFRFRLELAGIRVEGMTARRFAEWMWYEQVEPFGELRADWRAAQIVAMVHNTRVDEKHQKTVEKFLLKFEAKAKKQSVKDQIMILNILAASFGG